MVVKMVVNVGKWNEMVPTYFGDKSSALKMCKWSKQNWRKCRLFRKWKYSKIGFILE
jgi:hypothetical protein